MIHHDTVELQTLGTRGRALTTRSPRRFLDARHGPSRTTTHTLLFATLAIAVGCSAIAPAMIETRRHASTATPIRTIAVVPVQSGGPLARITSPALVAAEGQLSLDLGNALIAFQLQVVPSDAVAATLAADPLAPTHDDPGLVIRLVNAEYGVDALLFGELLHYRERSGSAAGSSVPASVAFNVDLREAATGKLLWSATFDETQASLMLDPRRTAQLPGGGTRWLRAQELARFGAERVARALAAYVASAASPAD